MIQNKKKDLIKPGVSTCWERNLPSLWGSGCRRPAETSLSWLYSAWCGICRNKSWIYPISFLTVITSNLWRLQCAPAAQAGKTLKVCICRYSLHFSDFSQACLASRSDLSASQQTWQPPVSFNLWRPPVNLLQHPSPPTPVTDSTTPLSSSFVCELYTRFLTGFYCSRTFPLSVLKRFKAIK